VNSDYIAFVNNDYATVEAFKTAMSGKILNFERATHLTSNTDLSGKLVRQHCEPNGTVTLVNTYNMNTSNEILFYSGEGVVPRLDSLSSGLIGLHEEIVDLDEKKQDKLSTQTAYSAKGTAIKVPQITTNTLGQVTKIEEKDITCVRYDANQSLNNTQNQQARSNVGAGTSSFSGSYPDLIDKPTIPATNVIPTTTTANKVLLSTTTSGTAKWSDFSSAGFLKTSNTGVISVDTNSYLTTSGTAADSSKLNGQSASYYAKATDLSSYLPLSGGTVTGDLTVNGAGHFKSNLQVDGSITNLSKTGGIYWNPYVESASDSSDAASIRLIPGGVAGGTELRIQQANDSNDVINLVAPNCIYLNSKRTFDVYDSWLRINGGNAFSSGVYIGNSIVRTDGQFQVGDGGSKFRADSSGNVYASNSVKINKCTMQYNTTDDCIDFIFS